MKNSKNRYIKFTIKIIIKHDSCLNDTSISREFWIVLKLKNTALLNFLILKKVEFQKNSSKTLEIENKNLQVKLDQSNKLFEETRLEYQQKRGKEMLNLQVENDRNLDPEKPN